MLTDTRLLFCTFVASARRGKAAAKRTVGLEAALEINAHSAGVTLGREGPRGPHARLRGEAGVAAGEGHVFIRGLGT